MKNWNKMKLVSLLNFFLLVICAPSVVQPFSQTSNNLLIRRRIAFEKKNKSWSSAIHRRYNIATRSETTEHDVTATTTTTITSPDELQQALAAKERESHRPSWLKSASSLPFDCTACGKCCKTIGTVYMSPEEVSAAANYVNMTTELFIGTYAEKVLFPTNERGNNGNDVPWIILDDQATEKGPACIFLDTETNHCKIYPVRPIQCSTYPFWPEIMKSKYDWNNEVRRPDDDDDTIDNRNDDENVNRNDEASSLPFWTAEDGGCEGMKKVDSNTLSQQSNHEGTGVTMREALEKLSLYKASDRRLPDGDFHPRKTFFT